MGWVFVLVVVVVVLGGLGWLLLDEAFVRVEPGKVGLVVVRGRATDRALLPGPHIVPAFRRITIVKYPSLELAFRAGDTSQGDGDTSDVERAGPAVRVTLGDRVVARVAYTVRFRLDPAALRMVHERFGSDGIWAAARDQSARTVQHALADPTHGIDDLFGSGREALEQRVGDAVTAAMAADGLVVTFFALTDVDLGRTGQVIQAITRARFELDREEAEAATRVARARNDASLEEHLGRGSVDAALRYREVDAWRDLVSAIGDRSTVLRGPIRTAAGGAPGPDGTPVEALTTEQEPSQAGDEA